MTIARIDSAWPVLGTDFQISLNGLLMGTGTPYRLRGLDGLGMPPVRSSDAERAGAHGSFGGQDLSATRDIAFDLMIQPGIGDPVLGALVQNLLAAWAPTSADVGLAMRVPGIGPLVFIGRPRKCDAPYDLVSAKGGRVDARVLFTALDPVKYAAALKDVVIGYGTAGVNAGHAFNAATPGAGMSFAPKRFIQNPSFESTTLTPWTTTFDFLNAGAVLTRDLATVHDGLASGKIVTSGASQFQGINQRTLNGQVRPNTTYTFSMWVNLATAGGNILLILIDLANGNANVNSAGVTTIGTWQRINCTITTGPADPAQLSMVVRDNGSAVARTFYLDGSQLDVGPVAQPFVDVSALMGTTFGAIGGGAGAAGFQQLVNAGTVETAPVTRISALTGPVTGPLHLERVESGEDIELAFNLSANDVLELDHDLHSVTLNGVVNRADVVDLASRWWKLRPGTNTIHYRSEGPGVGSTAEVLWRDASW